MGCVRRVRKLSVSHYCGFLKTLSMLNLGILRNLFFLKCLDPVENIVVDPPNGVGRHSLHFFFV